MALSVLLALTMALRSACADVTVPAIIGSNMVLQRDMPVPIWGWADPDEEVTVTFSKYKATVRADAMGKWTVRLPAMKVGGPLMIIIQGKNRIKLENVLVGEVWICSGQSNMGLPVAKTVNAKQEIAAANYPRMRLFIVSRATAGEPQENCKGSWKVCTPHTVRPFSAVGYYFGRRLHKEMGVPFGLIMSAYGGTRIEPWIPLEGYDSVPKLKSRARELVKAQEKYRSLVISILEKHRAWLEMADKLATVGRPIPKLPEFWPKTNRGKPSHIYSAMIAPLVPYGIRGAIWYQGESNVGHGIRYHLYMKALIQGWRRMWCQGDLPFYYVQIAPFRYKKNHMALPEIWEAQSASLSIPNTGMAFTIDVGNLRDIHPRNKQEVGNRLALWAMAKTYGRSGIVYSGPMYKSMSIEVDKIRIWFDNIGGGLTSRDGKPLSWFEIADIDRKFVQAKATIEGGTVVVQADEIRKPVAVRFGWHQEAMPNLINKEGLPALPFRTARW